MIDKTPHTIDHPPYRRIEGDEFHRVRDRGRLWAFTQVWRVGKPVGRIEYIAEGYALVADCLQPKRESIRVSSGWGPCGGWPVEETWLF